MKIVKRKKILEITTLIIVLIITFVFIAPVLWQYISAFKSSDMVISNPPVFIFKPTLQNWIELEKTKQASNNLINSLIIISISTSIIIFLSLLSGYGLARFKFKGRNFIGLLVLVLTMIPVVVLLIPFYDVMRALGLIGTHAAIILVYVIFTLPFGIWLMRGFFLEVPIEIEEAAFIDGCSRIRVLFRIAVPLSKPGIFATIIFTIMFTWSDFVFAGILGSKSSHTLPVLASATLGKYHSAWGQLAAVTIMITLPVVIFAMFTQKHLVKGLTHGAVKG